MIDELTRLIQNKVSYCMLIADNIILLNKTRRGVIVKKKLEEMLKNLKGFG